MKKLTRGGKRKGAGRPKGDKTKFIGIRPPLTQIAAMKKKKLPANTKSYVQAMDDYLSRA